MPEIECGWFCALPSGSQAEWATAGVALLALIAAVWAGRAAWKQNRSTNDLLDVERAREDRAERTEERRTEAEARAHQADQIAVWTTYFNGYKNYTPGVHTAVVRNQSALPIYEVSVTFFAPDGRAFDAEETFGVVAPGELTVPIPNALLAVSTRDPSSGLDEGTLYFWHDFDQHLRASIEFRDTAGRQWGRDRNGLLTQVDDSAS